MSSTPESPRHQPQLGNISLINVEKAATKNIVLEPLSRLLSPLGRFATFFTTHPISGTLVLPKATGLGQPSGETTLWQLCDPDIDWSRQEELGAENLGAYAQRPSAGESTQAGEPSSHLRSARRQGRVPPRPLSSLHLAACDGSKEIANPGCGRSCPRQNSCGLCRQE